MPIELEDPTNYWVKMCNNMCHQEHGVFYHYEVPVYSKNKFNSKVTLFKNFFPTLIKYNENLIKIKEEASDSHVIGRTIYEVCTSMIDNHNKTQGKINLMHDIKQVESM